jgi:hypothetical protein
MCDPKTCTWCSKLEKPEFEIGDILNWGDEYCLVVENNNNGFRVIIISDDSHPQGEIPYRNGKHEFIWVGNQNKLFHYPEVGDIYYKPKADFWRIIVEVENDMVTSNWTDDFSTVVTNSEGHVSCFYTDYQFIQNQEDIELPSPPFVVGVNETGRALRRFYTEKEASEFISSLIGHEKDTYYLDGPEYNE